MLIHIVHIFCMFVQLVYISRAEDGAENPLVKLIELQTEHCTAASLCTFAAKGESSPHQNESCCFACSCEAECTRHGNCCPDYHLLDTIGRDVSYSISEFSERLTNVNVTKDSRLTCVEASEPNFRKIHERSEISYKMIASCPANFLGNPDILNKCNEPKDMTKFEYDLFIPVTSLKSGTTYRNMYCFFCNEELHERTDAAIWTTTLSCDNSYHREVIEVTPHEFFTSTMQGGVYYCNLVFSPNSVIRSYFDINRCEMVDIGICPDGSNKQLEKICDSFHLPVTYFTNPWSYKRYRNIACFLCNVETPFNPVCNIKIFVKNPYGLELNIQLNESNAVIHSDENQQDVLNVDVIEKEDNECRTGFIRNTSTTNEISCSRVLCPWNFYIHEGVCIPTFTRLHNLMFRAMLEVRRAEVYGQAMLDEIRVNYMKKIETIGSLLFRQFSFGLWEKGNDYDFLVVAFTAEDESYNYLDMMKLYALFLERVCLLKISAKSSLVTISTFQTRSPGQDIETIDFMVPKPTMIRKFETPDSSMKWLELFVTHLCYRVTVPHSEKDYYIENHYTSIAIQGTDYGMVKVCVDDMYGKTTDTRSGFMFGDTCAKTTVDFIQNKQNYKTTNIVNDRNNNDNNDDNKNNNNGDNNVIDDENNNNNNNNNGENNVIDDKNNNNTNNNDDGNENINRNDKKVSNDVLRTPDTSEKWEWSLDLSTGLFVGGIALVATVAVIVVVILRKRKQRAEVNEEYIAQESQGK